MSWDPLHLPVVAAASGEALAEAVTRDRAQLADLRDQAATWLGLPTLPSPEVDPLIGLSTEDWDAD